jgi:hypothetical protein
VTFDYAQMDGGAKVAPDHIQMALNGTFFDALDA